MFSLMNFRDLSCKRSNHQFKGHRSLLLRTRVAKSTFVVGQQKHRPHPPGR
jgi:hypothetical protein